VRVRRSLHRESHRHIGRVCSPPPVPPGGYPAADA
jgi:hypothetical protein